eukprot:5202382-Alexandrium_andersonii.AAC.1
MRLRSWQVKLTSLAFGCSQPHRRATAPRKPPAPALPMRAASSGEPAPRTPDWRLRRAEGANRVVRGTVATPMRPLAPYAPIEGP